MATDRITQITDIAETYIRNGGYKGFSFRDIANDIGIKSASVHYHFPTKSELAVKVAQRYTARFLETLGDPNDDSISPITLLQQYIALFTKSLSQDKKMCLCGVLAAESIDLPEEVREEAKTFFLKNIDWLSTVYSRMESNKDKEQIRLKASRLLATLEGAMLIGLATGNSGLISDLTEELTN